MAPPLRTSPYVNTKPLITELSYYKPQKGKLAKADEQSSCTDIGCLVAVLPACRACNGNKGVHDTVAAPIVNPTIDEPKDHLGFRTFRYKWKTAVGKETVILLDLNNTEKRCKPRFSICNEVDFKGRRFP